MYIQIFLQALLEYLGEWGISAFGLNIKPIWNRQGFLNSAGIVLTPVFVSIGLYKIDKLRSPYFQ